MSEGVGLGTSWEQDTEWEALRNELSSLAHHNQEIPLLRYAMYIQAAT